MDSLLEKVGRVLASISQASKSSFLRLSKGLVTSSGGTSKKLSLIAKFQNMFNFITFMYVAESHNTSL